LLNFSQNLSTPSKNAVQGNANGQSTPTSKSNRLAESIVSDVVESLAADRAHDDVSSIVASNDGSSAAALVQPQRNSRTFFRAPGLAPDNSAVSDSNGKHCRKDTILELAKSEIAEIGRRRFL
jgi:hypothetical protein